MTIMTAPWSRSFCGAMESGEPVHVEVQGTREAGFAERSFIYNYMMFDRYSRTVASLVVLADAVPV